MAGVAGPGFIVVEHVAEVEAALAEAGVVKIPAALRKVTVEGAKPLRAAIREAAPVGQYTPSQAASRAKQNDVSGNLRKGVRYKVSRGSKGERYTIGPFGKGTAHRGLVIFGHRIKGHQRSIGGFGRGHLGQKATSGKTRTTPNSFVKRGVEASSGVAVSSLEAAATAAIKAVA